jgi:ElaB/YqjD/DUF883 family membrane-anchored ribosome-binding protein
MPVDAVVSRELKSLQEELSTSQRERSVAPANTTGATAAAAEPAKETVEEHELRNQLREFVDEITEFFQEAEKSISAHPTESVVGALLVGILIGWMLGRR